VLQLVTHVAGPFVDWINGTLFGTIGPWVARPGPAGVARRRALRQRAVVSLATRAPSIHNSQPWQWRLADSSMHLFADTSRLLPATDPDGRDLLLSCGATLHHLRVALAAEG
jgi:hypothetical protein